MEKMLSHSKKLDSFTIKHIIQYYLYETYTTEHTLKFSPSHFSHVLKANLKFGKLSVYIEGKRKVLG